LDIDRLIEFIKGHTPYTIKDEELRNIIELHIKYKTCLIVYDDNNNICALARWNISKDGTCAHILDVMIRRDYRNKKLLMRMLAQGRKMYPNVKYIAFEREEKYPYRKLRVYKLKEEENGWKNNNYSTHAPASAFDS